MKPRNKNLILSLALLAGVGLMPAGRATAQTLTTLHSFTGDVEFDYRNSDGIFPHAGLTLSGNTLYGTASGGGNSAAGTVFKVNTDGTGFTNLHSFSFGIDGAYPQAGLIVSGNTLYGTASRGGGFNKGTVFRINTDGTGFTTLHSFATLSSPSRTNREGAHPQAGLILSGNTLYGTAREGGNSGRGTVFKINTDGTGFTNLHSFTATDPNTGTNSDGVHPQAELIISGTTLYGTASRGGRWGVGTVFAVNTDGTGFTNLYSFAGTGVPLGGLVLSGSTLYGTATLGGPPDAGTIFKISTNGTGFTLVHAFAFAGGGRNPQAGLILSDNTLYGTAREGGSSDAGTVFKVNTNGTGFTILYSFPAAAEPDYTNSGGAYPQAGLILSGNTLYGTAATGGSWGNGTVFAVNTDGTGFTNLHGFAPTAGALSTTNDGAYPQASLTLSGATLFGTASAGGNLYGGTMFKLNTDGTGYTNLHSFAGGPQGILIVSGNTVYGTEYSGGSLYYGSVFAINTDGTGFTNLHSFDYDNDGAYPQAGVILSGNTLYGTAQYGGSSGGGTVFKINTDGTGFTNLHSFAETFTNGLGAYTNSDGAYPQAGVILSGNTLYGTASEGGSSGYGTVFKVNTDGTGFTNLHSFTGDEGAIPYAGLMLAGTTLYGTATSGGSSGNGTVFALNTDGTGFTSLHSFTGDDGASPYAGLILSGTTLYGTAASGGSSGGGTVFAVNTDGTGFTNLYGFTGGNDGESPQAELILLGNILYGTASYGGSSGAGTVFSLSPPPPPPPFTTLHNFSSIPNDGAKPQAGLIVVGNRLYGAADSGGTSGVGTVFAINTDGTDYTTLYSLIAPFDFDSPDSKNADGAYPDVTLVFSGNTLYGTAYWGGVNGNGTVFKVTTNGTGFTTLHSFSAGSGSFPFNYTNSDGVGPEGGLVLSGSTLYGTTEKGGTSGYGTVFKVNADGTGFTNLHSFTGGSDGEIPEALLISGNTLYGTAMGFISGNGTVFKINTDGTGFSVLHTFTATNFTAFTNDGPGPEPIYANSDGFGPTGLAVSGNTLYGTAYAGGAWGNGTVFALNTDGTGFNKLHDFAASFTNSAGVYTNSAGAHPIAFSGLVISGNTLYGTANYGGRSGNGTVFTLNTDGTGFTTLHDFSALDPLTRFNGDGANPYAGLVLSDNSLYGTARRGGSSGDGTVFSFRLPVAPPQLTIFRAGSNVVLTWPINATGFTLQSTTNLDFPAVWTTASSGSVVVSGQSTVTNPISGAQQFYRLIR